MFINYYIMPYKKIISLLLILWVLTTSTASVFAVSASTNSCEACLNTSPYIDKYLEFGDEIIKTMLTYANKETSVFATPSNPNINTQWNTQTETNSDFERQLQSIADNLNKKAQTVVSAGYVASLVTIEAGFLDSWKSIGPMTQNQAIMRDWTKLDTLWQKIMNAVLDLWNAWVFIRLGFKEWFQERINSIILSYSTWSDALFTPINNWTSFSYAPTDILSAMWTMNQWLKSVIGVWIKDSLNNTYLNDQIRFSQWMQDALAWTASSKWYYSCAQRLQWINACSELWNEAKESAKAIRDDTKKETKNAKKIVTDAVKRLQDFRSKNGATRASSKPRLDDYLRSIYWVQWVRSNDGEPLVAGFRDAWKSVRNEISNISPFAGLSKNANADTNDAFTVWDIGTKVSMKVNEDIVAQTLNDTLNTAQTNWKDSLFASVDPVSRDFPLVTQEIVSARYKIDSNANSIIQNLWKACDAQCSNVGWKCRATQ